MESFDMVIRTPVYPSFSSLSTVPPAKIGTSSQCAEWRPALYPGAAGRSTCARLRLDRVRGARGNPGLQLPLRLVLRPRGQQRTTGDEMPPFHDYFGLFFGGRFRPNRPARFGALFDKVLDHALVTQGLGAVERGAAVGVGSVDIDAKLSRQLDRFES